MKKIINWMLVASAFTVGIAGCTNDKAPGSGTLDGDPTAVEIQLQFTPNRLPGIPEAETRATQDPNAKVEETDLKTADIFIYSGNGDFLRREHLATAAFTQQTSTTTADVWQTSTPISTTTGPKYFLVGINIPSAAATSLEGKPMASATTEIQTIARADIAIANGLPMFSLQPVAATMQQDATQNRVTVDVKRIVAKVTVKKDANITQSGAAGYIGPMTWAVNNQNSKYFLQQGAAPNYADPNWTSAQYNAADFSAAVAPGDYVGVNEASPAPTTATYNALYALENTSQNKTQKELTRITIRAQFTPQRWVATGGYNNTQTPRQPPTYSNNPNYNATTPSSSTPTTFYTVVRAVGQPVDYFQSQTDANNYSADNGNATVNTFTDGYCYWNFFLNNGHNGEVYRNDYYQCNITRVVAPGNATPAITSPDAPPATSTTVTAVVNILYWNAVPMENKELIP